MKISPIDLQNPLGKRTALQNKFGIFFTKRIKVELTKVNGKNEKKCFMFTCYFTIISTDN